MLLCSNGSLLQDCWRGGVAYCRTLNSALEGIQAAATHSVSVVVHPGVYQPHSSITLTHVNIVSISGLGEGVVVKCSERSALVFVASQDIVIENIKFLGQFLEKESLNTDVISGLSFYNCSSITLSLVHVTETKGIGVLFHNSFGTNIIEHI